MFKGGKLDHLSCLSERKIIDHGYIFTDLYIPSLISSNNLNILQNKILEN